MYIMYSKLKLVVLCFFVIYPHCCNLYSSYTHIQHTTKITTSLYYVSWVTWIYMICCIVSLRQLCPLFAIIADVVNVKWSLLVVTDKIWLTRRWPTYKSWWTVNSYKKDSTSFWSIYSAGRNWVTRTSAWWHCLCFTTGFRLWVHLSICLYI